MPHNTAKNISTNVPPFFMVHEFHYGEGLKGAIAFSANGENCGLVKANGSFLSIVIKRNIFYG